MCLYILIALTSRSSIVCVRDIFAVFETLCLVNVCCFWLFKIIERCCDGSSSKAKSALSIVCMNLL